MSLSPQLFGIVFLNLVAVVLLLAVEIAARRRPAAGRARTDSSVSLDDWIKEVEQAESAAPVRDGAVPRAVRVLRQIVAARGRNLPSVSTRA